VRVEGGRPVKGGSICLYLASKTASCPTKSTGARPLVSLCEEQRNLGASSGEQKRRDVGDAWHLGGDPGPRYTPDGKHVSAVVWSDY